MIKFLLRKTPKWFQHMLGVFKSFWNQGLPSHYKLWSKGHRTASFPELKTLLTFFPFCPCFGKNYTLSCIKFWCFVWEAVMTHHSSGKAQIPFTAPRGDLDTNILSPEILSIFPIDVEHIWHLALVSLRLGSAQAVIYICSLFHLYFSKNW